MKVSHRDPVAQRGFTQLENAVLFDTSLSTGARLLYMALKHYSWKADGEVPAQTELAEAIGVSTRSVGEYGKELVEAGYVTTERRRNLPARYIIEPVGSAKSAIPGSATSADPDAQDLPIPRASAPEEVQDVLQDLPSELRSSGAPALVFEPAPIEEEPRTYKQRHADVYVQLVKECYPAGVTLGSLTKAEQKKVAVAATNIVQAAGTPEQVAERATRYRAHKTYGDCELTAPALASHWAELDPGAATVRRAPCPDCGVGGGLHVTDCPRAAGATA